MELSSRCAKTIVDGTCGPGAILAPVWSELQKRQQLPPFVLYLLLNKDIVKVILSLVPERGYQASTKKGRWNLFRVKWLRQGPGYKAGELRHHHHAKARARARGQGDRALCQGARELWHQAKGLGSQGALPGSQRDLTICQGEREPGCFTRKPESFGRNTCSGACSYLHATYLLVRLGYNGLMLSKTSGVYYKTITFMLK